MMKNKKSIVQSIEQSTIFKNKKNKLTRYFILHLKIYSNITFILTESIRFSHFLWNLICFRTAEICILHVNSRNINFFPDIILTKIGYNLRYRYTQFCQPIMDHLHTSRDTWENIARYYFIETCQFDKR